MSDIIEWLRDRAFRKSGPTMEAVHTKQQEWVWAEEIERLRADNEKLRAALAFYADKDTWRSSTSYMCGHIGETRASMDKGEKARAAALKEMGDE